MHVVVVDEELPYPAISGKRIRILNLLGKLAQRHRITLLSHRNEDPNEVHAAQRHLRQLGIEAIVVERLAQNVSARRGPHFLWRLVRNLASPLPFSAQVHDCPNMRRAIRRYAAKHHVDLWQCEWAPYAVMMNEVSGAPWVMMAHDIQTMIWQRSYKTEAHPLKRRYIGIQLAKYRRFEQHVFRSAPLAVTVTHHDAIRARRIFGAQRLAVVDNGVDVPGYAANGQDRNHHEILFLGSLDWRANLDAVRLLLEQIFPRVLALRSAAHLTIVGRRPPEWLQAQVSRMPQVTLHGNVPDVRPFLRRAGVMAVPLRIGGGSRLKILEALASQLPVVSTRVGAEGLNIEPGDHYVLADGAGPMAEAIVDCLQRPEAYRGMIQAGGQVVEQHYDWSVLALKLEQAWRTAASAEGLSPAHYGIDHGQLIRAYSH